MTKPATIVDIAQALKMSPSTVSKALSGHPAINALTKEKIKRKASELNYVPNEAARMFQQKRSNCIGVILPTLKNHFYVDAISGIEAAAMQNNYRVLICQSHESIEKEKELTNMMLLQRVDALIIVISKQTNTYQHIQQLEKMKIPVLYFVRIPKLEQCNYIKNNVFEAAETATNFLIKKGHRYIAHLKGPDDLMTSLERLEGYKSALRKARLPIEETLIQTTDFQEANTILAFKKLLNAPVKPTAVLTFKDYVALDAIEYLKKRNHNLLHQMEFVGFGNLPDLRYMNYPLSASVEEYPYKLGEKAITQLMQLINQQHDQKPLQICERCTLQVFTNKAYVLQASTS
jgi:LacI family transcriptional regulator